MDFFLYYVKIVIGFVIQYILSTGAGSRVNQEVENIIPNMWKPSTGHIKKEYRASCSVSGKFTGYEVYAQFFQSL